MAQQNLQETLYADILPIARRISATDRYAITIGGSRGKGVADMRSDYDFRIYYETRVHDSLWNAIMEDLERCMRKWREQGIEIDGIWPRSIDEIDRELDLWLSGNGLRHAHHLERLGLPPAHRHIQPGHRGRSLRDRTGMERAA